MGLVDKLKNIFTEEVTEEEEEEIKVEQIKKEVRSVPIESPVSERKEKKVTRVEKRRVPVPDEELMEEEPVAVEEEKAKSPVFFTDRDFEDLVTPKKSREKVKAEKVEEPKKEEAPKPYGGTYNSTTIIHREKQNFKPTPIISPVYGVLDKNYHKEDIIDKNEDSSKDSVDGLSVDTIRNKAYGTLEDELEDTIVTNPSSKKLEADKTVEEDVDLFDELEQSDEVKKNPVSKPAKDVRKLEEITMDLTKELDNLLLKKEKDKKEEKEIKELEEVISEKVSPKEEKKEEILPESDLFNLIDSMYEEGEED